MKNRPERLICFLVVWLTMFSCISGKGQIILKKTDLTPDFKHLWLPGSDAEASHIEARRWSLHGHLDRSWGVVLAKTMTTDQEYLIIPSDIYYIQSGFFCKREWELEKTIHTPLRIRLGSLADCNALEGKH
jgi:hypothetical protein